MKDGRECNPPATIAVFGMGYVGVVSAACLAARGHRVVGCDINEKKLELIAAGRAPIVEPGIAELVRDAVAGRRLEVTASTAAAVAAADISFICVGTPSRWNGSLDLSSIESACEHIGMALAKRRSHHTIVVRSTVLPGTIRGEIIPRLERWSGRVAGRDFAVVSNPEFLREGTAVHDFDHPPKTVIGADREADAARVAALYGDLDAPLFLTRLEVAESLKYIDNTWHALKVAFGNEVGNLCKSLGVDSMALMEMFCRDVKLNISPAYLRPGFAFGGSCLPKDVRALAYRARELDLKLPLLDSILPSNVVQIERAVRAVMSVGKRKVGLFGLAFKAATDDMRESPLLELVERLIGKGYQFKIYDPNVQLSFLTGANRQYVLTALPHISQLMAQSPDEVLDHAELVVIGNRDGFCLDELARLRGDQVLIDLAGVAEARRLGDRYVGINW